MMRALLLLAVLAAVLRAERLTILHTNDIHAQMTPTLAGMGGISRLTTAMREARAACGPNCLYLDGGDLVQGSPVSTLFKGVPLFEFANLLGIDVGILGNHEFDYGSEVIPAFVATARFPILCANVVSPSGAPITGKAYTIRNVSGLRVGIIGVVMGELLNGYATRERVGNWKVLPVLETVKRYAAEVRPKADLVVVLSHTLDFEDEAVLREADVDVIIGGHDHAGLKQAKVVNGRVLVKCMSNTREYGRLELEIDEKTRKVSNWNWTRIPVDPKVYAEAPDAARLTAKWEARVSELVDQEIGWSERVILQDELKSLIERAMTEETGADLAFMNRGGVRAPLPKGKILARHIWNIIPFDNKVVMGRFMGSDLPALVKQGRHIDPGRMYTLAVSDFTAANQASRTQWGQGGFVFDKEFPVLQRDLVINWVKKQKVLE